MAFMIDYADDWRRGYIDLCVRVTRWGEVRNSRAGTTMELRDFVFTLSPESIDLPLGTGRNLHAALAAAEAIQLCCGVGMPELTEATSSRIAEFVRDPSGTVHGNYGDRVKLQIVDVVDKLRADPDSRQAVIQIWDRAEDSAHRVPMPKDIPCTLAITFGTSNGAITMSVVMRSNDVWLGLPFDVFQFRQLHRTVALLLARPLGQYCHHAVSMHAYDHDLGKIHGLQYDGEWQDDKSLPTGVYAPHAADLGQAFHRILSGSDQLERSHQWYFNTLGEAYASAVG